MSRIAIGSIGTVLLTLTLNAWGSPTQDPKTLKTIGNPDAKVGGTFSMSMQSEPENLNPINSTDAYSSDVHDFTCDGLMTLNEDTYELMPALAERYEIAKDGMSYTFFLRKDAKFHDGTPLTAADVKFSFDAIRNPEFKAGHRLPYFENFKSVEVVDPHTIKVNIGQKYFKNFEVISSAGFFPIVPEKQYSNPKKKMGKTVICSGPYKMGKYNKGKSLELDRNPDWWGWKVPYLKGRYNYSKIIVRFLKEENLRLQMMEKGQLDYLELGSEAFHKKTNDAPWGKTIQKIEFENQGPKGFGFVGWNLLDEKFKDKNVRVALAHLLNRELINEKFRYGKSELASGPWYKHSMYADSTVRPIQFDPEKAKKMLDQAGWKDADKDGIREKTINGKKVNLSFGLLLPSRDVEKYFTLYKEDLKKAGVNMDIQYVEWNTFLKNVDSKKFEALAMGWSGGSVHMDPKQIWHSEASRAGGSNFISYNNPEVDKLLDQSREIMDHQERAKLLKKAYKIIADDAPYIFMFNDKFEYYGLAPQVGQVKPTYRFGVGTSYWWTKQ
jgi:microcin C transport system substrate-binding protein